MSYNSRYLSIEMDSRAYRLAYLGPRLGCPICGVGRGCNKRYRTRQRSWKVYREKQYKREKEIRPALSNKTQCKCQRTETEQD